MWEMKEQIEYQIRIWSLRNLVMVNNFKVKRRRKKSAIQNMSIKTRKQHSTNRKQQNTPKQWHNILSDSATEHTESGLTRPKERIRKCHA